MKWLWTEFKIVWKDYWWPVVFLINGPPVRTPTLKVGSIKSRLKAVRRIQQLRWDEINSAFIPYSGWN